MSLFVEHLSTDNDYFRPLLMNYQQASQRLQKGVFISKNRFLIIPIFFSEHRLTTFKLAHSIPTISSINANKRRCIPFVLDSAMTETICSYGNLIHMCEI